MRTVETFWKPYIYETLLQFCAPILVWREGRYLDRKFADIIACPDNAHIPRHPDAGKVSAKHQIMHNGLKVLLNCYDGPTNKGRLAELFAKNKGVHEPSEELAFQVLLETLPESATMLELGAWWSFYSMWFSSRIKNPKTYMIEPDRDHLEIGKKNFALNGFKGEFFNYFIGATSGFWKETKRTLLRGVFEVETTVPQICVDDFVDKNQIKFLDILHSDIQGAELDMLKGAERLIDRRGVRYFCISTHSDTLHQQCMDFLKAKNYVILCEADVTHSPHIDGYFVARAKEMRGPDSIPTHKLTN